MRNRHRHQEPPFPDVEIVYHRRTGDPRVIRPIDADDLRGWLRDLDLEFEDPELLRVEIRRPKRTEEPES